MTDIVRLDKWLWAARFFKTRALAREAIDGGKVHLNNSRPKPSKQVHVADTLEIRQGYDVKTVKVIALSDKRGSANIAALLYEETQASIEKREKNTKIRKIQMHHAPKSTKEITKKQRRQIIRFKRKPME